MYSEGTRVFDEEPDLISINIVKHEEFLTKYSYHCERKLDSDWMAAFLFSFGKHSMAENYEKCVKFLDKMYLSESYRNLDVNSEIKFAHNIVTFSIDILNRLCNHAEEKCSGEQEYVIIKFFMLACMTREDQLRSRIVEQYDEKNFIEKGAKKTAFNRSPEEVTNFLNFVKNKLNELMQSNFTEYNIVFLIHDFMGKVVSKWQGLLFESSDGTNDGDSQNRRNEPGSFNFGFCESAGRSRSLFSSITDDVEVHFSPFEDGSEFASPYESEETKKRKNPERKGLPLPEMYKPEYNSVQHAAVAERKAAISYYALIGLMVSYYVHHYYNIKLPPDVHYEEKFLK